ncbi:hypothetical protein V7D15_01215 [Thermoanaerobacter thermohydrosulfuricus]|nr:hypothetical protein [Clostridia bacterium]
MIPSVFLDKQQLIEQELKFGNYSKKVFSSDESDKVLEIVWERGIKEAKKLKTNDIINLISEENIMVEISKKNYIFNYIVFSEYNKEKNKIILYEKPIKEIFIPSIPEKFFDWCNYNKVVKLFLCHEYFHYLEINYIGLTNEKIKTYTTLGFFKVKVKLKAFSEIAAHAFVKEFYDIW